MDQIEKVIYINLKERTDRREDTIQELAKIFPDEKILRFEAIKHNSGAIGCTMSHISVLEMAIREKWENVLILEDDIGWNTDFSLLINLLNLSYHVILLSGYSVNYDKSTSRVISSQTTGAYIVNSRYYQTLLNNYNEGLEKLLNTGNLGLYAIDRYWKHLQVKDNWYIIQPNLCFQKPSYSDIEKRHVNYNKKKKLKNFRFSFSV